jgi:hypothetical protein
MKRFYSDFLENSLVKQLISKGISFFREGENKEQRLDFYLPEYDVYIEVKQYHTDRVSQQLASQENVILIQGKKAMKFFIEHLK